MRKKSWLFIAAMLLCILWVVPGSRSEAAKRPTVAKRQTVYFKNIKYVGEPSYSVPAGTMANELIFIKNLPKNSKIRNIKCSKSKIQVQRDDTMYRNTLEIMIAGKVKNGEKVRVSFQVISGKKRYNLSTVLVFKRYSLPYSEIRVDSKKYSQDESGMILIDREKIAGSTARISTKARKGAKIKAMIGVYGYEGEPRQVTYRNGDRVDLSDLMGVVILYEYKKPAGFQKKLIRSAEYKDLGETLACDTVMIMFY